VLKVLHANPGVGASLTEQETKDFLTSGKLNDNINDKSVFVERNKPSAEQR
jgi:hypothetical protein